MTHIYVILDPITASPVWVAPTLEAAKSVAPTLELNDGIGPMDVPIYRYEQREGKRASNGIQVEVVTI